MDTFLLNTHPSWHLILKDAFLSMNLSYLETLNQSHHWLPGNKALLNAFKIPLDNVKFILLGESPYPRVKSANGYAFWDNDVKSLWGSQGFSTEVNRATSLRNWLKMLLGAQGFLDEDYSKHAIQGLDKHLFISTADAFFNRLIQQGFLLLNASLVFEEKKVNYHAKKWKPFIDKVLLSLSVNSEIKLILWGNIAQKVNVPPLMPTIIAEHPYNISFIHNQSMREFFKPFNLLSL